MLGILMLGGLVAADPQVTKTLMAVVQNQGESKAMALQEYAAGCHGKNRFAFRNNTAALEALRPALGDDDASVREAALGLIPCFPPTTFEDEIIILLEDRAVAVRERAFEEAAHLGTKSILLGVAAQVEKCTAKLGDLKEDEASTCVFALYALGEGGKAQKDAALRGRVAQWSVPFLRASQPKLREHGLRNVELCGGKAQQQDVAQMSGDALPAAEKAKAAAVAKALKKRH